MVYRARAFTYRRRSTITLLLACVFVSAQACADEWRYRVVEGDNLWNLSVEYLNNLSHIEELLARNNIPDPKKLPPGTILRIPVGWLKSLPIEQRIVGVRGEVSIDKANGVTGQAAAVGGRLAIGDTVRTGDRASATVEFEDGSRVLLSPGATLKIRLSQRYGESGAADRQLGLSKGSLENSVSPKQHPNSRFIITSPSAQTGVRNTRYRVHADADVTRVEVLEGSVDVASGGETLLLPAGFATIADAGQAPSAPISLLPAPSLDKIPTTFDGVPIRFSIPMHAGATQFRIQVFTVNDPYTTVVDEVADTDVTIPQLNEGQYRLRCRAIDSHGIEGESSEHLFVVNASSSWQWDLILFIGGALLLL